MHHHHQQQQVCNTRVDISRGADGSKRFGLFSRKAIDAGQVWWIGDKQRNGLVVEHGQYRSLYLSERTDSECSRYLWHGITQSCLYLRSIDAMWLPMDETRFITTIDSTTKPNDNKHNAKQANSMLVVASSSDETIDGVACVCYRVAVQRIEPDDEIIEDSSTYHICPWIEYPSSSTTTTTTTTTTDATQQQQQQVDQLGFRLEPNALDHIGAYVRDAGEHGMGLFVGRDVKANDIAWHATRHNVLHIPQAVWRSFYRSEPSRLTLTTDGWNRLYDAILVYSYYDASIDSLVLCLDNARFCNHNATNAVLGARDGMSVFVVDCARDTEIVDNYFEYDECPWVELGWEKFIGYPRKNAVDYSTL
jgi:hypothetical protein